MEKNHVRVNQGSKSDAPWTNKFIELLGKLGIRYGVSTGSCHWGAGKEFEDHVRNFPEDIIVVIGGMSLAAPGLMSALDRNAKRTRRIIIGIPLDKAAQSAIEDLPSGTPVLTCGYNRSNVDASITNAALAIANIISRQNIAVQLKLENWYKKMREKKRCVAEEELDNNGLLPIKEKK